MHIMYTHLQKPPRSSFLIFPQDKLELFCPPFVKDEVFSQSIPASFSGNHGNNNKKMTSLIKDIYHLNSVWQEKTKQLL